MRLPPVTQKFAFVFGLIAGLVALLVSSFFLVFPRFDLPETLVLRGGAAELARGQYLFDAVATCSHCHTQASYFSRFGSWTDGELLRAITAGVDRQGQALHYEMPYRDYAHFFRDDAEAVVLAVKEISMRSSGTQDPVVGGSESYSLWSRLVSRVLPRPAKLEHRARQGDPDFVLARLSENSSVNRGNYLATVARCFQCHKLDEVKTYAAWTEVAFVARFRQPLTSPTGENNKIKKSLPLAKSMPWPGYQKMTDADLKSIYHATLERAKSL